MVPCVTMRDFTSSDVIEPIGLACAVGGRGARHDFQIRRQFGDDLQIAAEETHLTLHR